MILTCLVQRSFAEKKSDETVLPGSESLSKGTQIPPVPNLTSSTTPNQTPPSRQSPPKVPPAAGNIKPTSTIPPTGPISADTPPPPPPPKKRSHWFTRLLTNLIILSALGYGIGIYYALTSDRVHDFFTEYIPFGEDVVAYFEEREFRKRLTNRPQHEHASRLHHQVRGEAKVTIPGRAGATVKHVEQESDLGAKGRHSSAVEAPAPKKEDAPHPQTVQAHTQDRQPEKPLAVAASKQAESEAKEPQKAVPPPAPEPVKAEPAQHIDNINIENATEPVVQDLVKILNDIITVINADNAAGKYASTIDKAKGDISKIVSDISTLRDQEKKAADDKMKNLHTEFDSAARELISRTEQEIKDMEMRWMEEYENERSRIGQAYEEKLRSELNSANQVYDQKLKNELLKQAISLRQEFSKAVKDSVEGEREGRLGKLDELSSSVAELDKLTTEWNSVVDSTMSTQHLLVAVEAVRAALASTDKPRPFVAELAALKEVADDNAVVNAAIASINPTAYQRGISTPSQLIDRFRRVATEVRKAALLPENAGIASIAAGYFLSKAMFRKEGLPVGDDVESILTRSEVLLEEGNLEDAVREMNGLKGWARVLSGDWVAEGRRVLEVQQALDVSIEI
jgi:MICOS complex subunit MIC60